MKFFIRSIVLVYLILLINSIDAQEKTLFKDTIQLSIDSAESIFLRNNFLLLASKYNIDAQKALVIQAKLLPNPNFSFSRGPIIPIYDPNSQYPHSNLGLNSENAASISQLILLAGKRNKQIKLAEANVKLAEVQFFDLIRTLKYTLRSTFFNVYYQQHSAKVYDKEIQSLQKVVTAFNQQEGKGYIAEKEVIRVKAQLYSLQSEFNDLINQINDNKSQLRLILQLKDVDINPIVNEDRVASLNPAKFPVSVLIDTAYKSRTDLKIARVNTDINKLNYDYQKALAVPDLTASLSWDHQGSYAKDFQSAGIAIDLPFFNRNQGNIKSSKFMIENSIATEKSIELTVEEQICRAVQKAYDNNKLYQNIDAKFNKDFDRLLNEVFLNYEKRNMGLLDFLDFYDSYKQTTIQLNYIRYNRLQIFEDLNFYTGNNFYN